MSVLLADISKIHFFRRRLRAVPAVCPAVACGLSCGFQAYPIRPWCTNASIRRTDCGRTVRSSEGSLAL